MVDGIESFKEAFKDYPDCYTVIGGAACDILMHESDLTFRNTHDVDMILILEDKGSDFGKAFWKYIKEGGYKCGYKNSEEMQFYRFSEPKMGYPVQIELFSRKQDYHLDIEQGIVPIHMDDDTSSLSAILLNDDFYNFMMKGRRIVDGITVLGVEYIVPFKMYAWLNSVETKSNGGFVKERDLKKHKNDVFRLSPLITDIMNVELEGLVKEKVSEFLDIIKNEKIELQKLGVEGKSMDQILATYRKIYNLEK